MYRRRRRMSADGDGFRFFRQSVASLLGSLFVLSVMVFVIARLAPGDPLLAFYGDRAERLSPAQREWALSRLGLDAPLPVQYLRWLQNALQGEFGISYQYKQPVWQVIAARAPNTLLLGGIGFCLLFVLALALGAFCAWFHGRWPDRLLCRVGTLTSCIPEFWSSLVLILFFSVWLRILPSSGAVTAGGPGGVPDRLRHLILPLTAVVFGHLWYYAYLVRGCLLEQINADYVRFAKSVGLSRGAVLLRHCLRNVLPIYLSVMALAVPHVLGGTYVVETVFSYPGLGTLAYQSARYRDYNLLMVLCLLTGAVTMLCSIAGRALAGRIDPRQKEETP